VNVAYTASTCQDITLHENFWLPNTLLRHKNLLTPLPAARPDVTTTANIAKLQTRRFQVDAIDLEVSIQYTNNAAPFADLWLWFIS
jgi:hypothetical protein